MKGAHSRIASPGTGSCAFPNSACFTRLTSPIQRNRPGYSRSRSSMPGTIVSGRDRSGKVMASVAWTPWGGLATRFAALAKSFLRVGMTGVPTQSR